MIVQPHCHLGFSKYREVEKYCKQFFNSFFIQYFCYQRLYCDGKYTFLPSAPELGEYFFLDGAYPNTFLFSTHYSNLKSGFFLWDIAQLTCVEHMDVAIPLMITKTIGLKHGIDIINKGEKYCDIYSFASKNKEIYNCSTSFLTKLIVDFRKKFSELIDEVNQVYLYLPKRSNKIVLPIYDQETKIVNKFDKNNNRYYLGGVYADSYLTTREQVCWQLIVKGNSAKQVAKTLGISYHTVERHVENVKFKLNCSKLVDAVRILIQNNIITMS